MKYTRRPQLAFLEQHKTEDKILDIGAGFSPPYKHLFPNRVRVDVDKNKNPDIIGSIYNLPFEDNSQNTILCSEVFEHLIDPQAAADELHRVLRPEGKVLLTTRFMYPLHGIPNDYWRFTPYTLQNIFKRWDIEQMVFESEPFYTVGILLQRIGFQTTLRGGKFAKAETSPASGRRPLPERSGSSRMF